MKNIAINGFGRIGRVLFRILCNHPEFKVSVINDVSTPKVLSHLLKYDSVHGRFLSNVDYGSGYIKVNGQKIIVINFFRSKHSYGCDN